MRKTDQSLTPPWAQDSISLNLIFLNEYNYMYIYFLRQDLLAQVGLELTILLSLPPECLGYECGLPCPTSNSTLTGDC